MKALLVALITFVVVTQAHALPSFQEVKESYRKSDALLLDRHGEIIHELRIDPRGRRLDWISLRDISPSLLKAVLHSEDKRFYEHHGVDWMALGSAAITNLFTQRPRGASTITMQVISMLDKGLKPKGSKRTASQKWQQVKAAGELEETWSKDELLEAYLNLLTFRGELQGIAAASRCLFNKSADGLDEAEAFLLGSLIRSPNAAVRDVARRACALSDSMKAHTSCEALKRLAENKLSSPCAIKPRIALAPQVARQLLHRESGRVPSTIDGKLQRLAAGALRHHLDTLRDQNVREGAVLVVENRTGDILAYVANGGASHLDGVRARRQAGSTLKPFLYELALEKRILTAASTLDDSPLEVATSRGLYVPLNYDNDFKGPLSLRTVLSSSLNIPAVRTLMLLGPEVFVRRLRELSFTLDERGGHYGPSLALGAADVNLHELVNAYRTLANWGRSSPLRLTSDQKKAPARQIMDRGAAFIISDILSDRAARSLTFGFENPLSTPFWTAVKTGTSKDMRDNWCIGFSRRYTVGVWVGNFSGEPMWNVSGITGAAPVWLEVMNYLHRNTPGRQPVPPEEVTLKNIVFQRSGEPERDEWFLRGTEPALSIGNDTVIEGTAPVSPRIIYPTSGTIVVLDPDIPEEQQVIFFETPFTGAQLDWVLNDERIGSSKTLVPWRPIPGRHRLFLVDREKHIVDSAEFEVRGGF